MQIIIFYMDNSAEDSSKDEIVNVLLTDSYQIMMIYAQWKNERHNIRSVFDMYFRKCPFDLDFSVMGGMDECFDFLKSFKFTNKHLEYMRTTFPEFDKEFFEYISKLDLSRVNIFGVDNGSIVTPNTPLLILEGPINELQIVETTLLNLTNYPTLIASHAYKLKMLYPDKILIEDGSEYGQSPNGSISGCKYSIIGGVNFTTSIFASSNHDLELFISHPDIEEDLVQFSDILENSNLFILNDINLLNESQKIIINNSHLKTSDLFKSRLYQAVLLPQNFNIRITENIDSDQIANNQNIADFLIISYLLQKCGFTNQTLFFDLDNAYLLTQNLRNKIKFSESIKFSIAVRYCSKMLKQVSGDFDIIFLGADFLTCKAQTALGMVYKLMDFNNSPCIKFSEEKAKRTIPGFKKTLRFYDGESNIICDYLLLDEEYDNFKQKSEKTIKGFYPYDEDKEIDFSFCYYELITKLLFEKGQIHYKKNTAKELRKNLITKLDVLSKSKKINLYVSKGIIDIIRKEIKKNINNTI